MRKTHSSIVTVIVISPLLIINVIAFNWTSEFFRSRFGIALLRYGEQMPKLEGRGYSGDQSLSVTATKPTLVHTSLRQESRVRSMWLIKMAGDGELFIRRLTTVLLPR